MKQVKIGFAALTLYFLMSSSNCKKWGHGDDRLTVSNNSDKNIYVVLQYNYPDTSINDESWTYLAYNHLGVDSLSSKSLWNSKKWDKVIRDNNSSNTIMVFVYDVEAIAGKTWPEIQSSYEVLKRYDLTVGQLNSMGWNIIYP